mgnify:CR=1 FL=1
MKLGRKPKYDVKIRNLLRTHAGMRAAKIAKSIEIPYSQAFTILKRMQAEGKVVKQGKAYINANWQMADVVTSNTPIAAAKPVEKTNPKVDALKAELEYIRTTVNNLVQTGEYIKDRIKELEA